MMSYIAAFYDQLLLSSMIHMILKKQQQINHDFIFVFVFKKQKKHCSFVYY